MDDPKKFINMRRHPRISWAFIVKFRRWAKESSWQSSTIKNISVGGCYFGSMNDFSSGEILEIQVKLPAIKEPLLFKGQVKRCDRQEGGNIYFVAVEFLEMDESKKEEFTRVMTFFIKKQNNKKT